MQHQFTVPAPVEVAWSALLDLERVAPCMPGATLTKAEGNEFAGSVKVKLGPISLLYKGNGTFTDIDAEARRVVIDASGKDSRGNGTAAATVTAVLTAEGESTSVTVDTDLKITGKPAQFGRGLISEVGGKILNQFADCLAGRLAEGEPAAGAAAPPTAEASTSANGDRSTAKPVETNGEPAAPAERAGTPAPPTTSAPGWRTTPAEGATASATSREAPAAEPPPPAEAIDLLGTAGAPMLKRIAPIAVAVVVVLLILRRRRRRRQR